MKRIFTIIALVAISMFAMAQTNQLVWSNGRLIYGTSIETIDSLTYGEMEDIDTLHLLLPRTLIKVVHDTVYVHDTIYINNCDPETPEVGTHEYVDLGLSEKWATCNVGATTPEEYGDYFAWGEVEVELKTTYDWSTYKYCAGTYNSMTKYCDNSSYGKDGFTDNKTVLDPEDDAAAVNWGGAWRMPTTEEQQELVDNCTWDWTTQNGVNGYKVTGPNGNSIFLPAAGCMLEGSLYDSGLYGYYWSSSLYTGSPRCAYYVVGYYSGHVYWSGNDDRYYGHSVRPVCQQNLSFNTQNLLEIAVTH